MNQYQDPKIEIITFETDEPIAAASGSEDNYIPLFGNIGDFPE